MFDNSATLLGRGICTGACKLSDKIEFYMAQDGTLYAYVLSIGDKTVSDKGVIAGYAAAMARRGNRVATYDRGEVTVTDES